MAINRGRESLGEPDVRPLAPRQVERCAESGALVVDVRTELQFDEAHVPGAVSITVLRAGFGSKLAWLADPEGDVVFVGRDDEDARHAAHLAASVGVTRIAGALHGGMTSWREERRPVHRVERLTIGFGSESFGSPTRLAETLAADPAARRDESVRQSLGEIVTEMTAVRFMGYRALTALQQGQNLLAG